ncbi:MAG: DUF1947 domain-containing protein [Metallosphaera sp.]
MQKHVLSQKDVREFKNKIKMLYNIDINANKIEIGKDKKRVFYFLDDVLCFFDDKLIPTLCFLQKNDINMPWVKIDEGAVKAIVRGADLYAPGVLESSGNLMPGSLIVVKARQGQPVAVMMGTGEMIEALSSRKGKVATSLHWIGDEVWNMCKSKT